MSNLQYDLHCHSNKSDGRLTPIQLVERASERGVNVLALTDHDTVNGVVEAQQTAKRVGVTLITGIEFSTQWNGRGVHIVGLNFDPNHSVIAEAVASQEKTRTKRALMIGEKLAKLGIAGAYEGACELAGEGVVGRPHFAQYMINQGVVSSMDAAFKRYLGTGKPGDVKQCWPVMAQAIEWIKAAGGIAVLAHPDKYKVTRTKLCAMIEDFKAAGGEAMEVVSGKQQPNITRDMTQLVERYQLLASRGSDFHFPDTWQELGAMPELPESCQPVWEKF